MSAPPDDVDPTTLRQLLEELAEARKQISALTSLVSDQARLLRAIAPSQKLTTIQQLYDAFREARQADQCWVWIRNRLLPLVRRLGPTSAMDLTPGTWAEHLAERKKEPTPRDRPPADHTLNIELQRAKEMMDFGVTHGLLDYNPLKPARKIRTISARETWLSEPQIQQLLTGIAAIPTARGQMLMRAFILCAVDAMLRFNEVRRLRRDRIARDGVIELRAQETKARKRRTVALTPRALAAIGEVPPVIGTQYVFANPDTGKLFGEQTMRLWFRTACVASGIDAFAAEGERVVPHTMRHSGASAADARGASAMAIKAGLGHASLATTEKYLHRHMEASARELAAIMANGAEAERRGPRKADAHDVGEATPKSTKVK
jgi:integrase